MDVLADAIGSADFLTWSEWSLARVGFRPNNSLALVSVCRDELMEDFQRDVARVWGSAFSVGALGGLVFAGRTGLAAALSHVPGEDGRHRFVAFCFPHIGLDEHGELGRVQRRGRLRASTACGALESCRKDLMAGRRTAGVDVDDVEQSLLRARLSELMEVGAQPSLLELTSLARTAAVADLRRYIGLARAAEPVDVACISGIVVHGPDAVDQVTSVQADVTIDGGVIALPH